MTYQKMVWQDEILDGQGNVVQEGTWFTADRANKIEQGIADAHMLAEAVAQTAIGNAVSSGLTFTSTGLTANYTAGTAYVNGVRFDVTAGSIALNPTQGQYIYLDSDGTVKNTTSQATAQAKCLLWYFATDASNVITSTDRRSSTSSLKNPPAAAVSIADTGNKFTATDVEAALSELVSKDSTVESNAKAYTDQQIAMVTATGIPKLVSYSYILTATTNGQTDFDIPLSTFVPATDTVLVGQNRTWLEATAYSIGDFDSNGIYTIRLSEGVATGAQLGVLILKNVPIGPNGSVSGSVIADGTITAAKVAADVATQTKLDQVQLLNVWEVY